MNRLQAPVASSLRISPSGECGPRCTWARWFAAGLAVPEHAHASGRSSPAPFVDHRLKSEGHYIIGVDWKRNEHMPVRIGEINY